MAQRVNTDLLENLRPFIWQMISEYPGGPGGTHPAATVGTSSPVGGLSIDGPTQVLDLNLPDYHVPATVVSSSPPGALTINPVTQGLTLDIPPGTIDHPALTLGVSDPSGALVLDEGIQVLQFNLPHTWNAISLPDTELKSNSSGWLAVNAFGVGEIPVIGVDINIQANGLVKFQGSGTVESVGNFTIDSGIAIFLEPGDTTDNVYINNAAGLVLQSSVPQSIYASQDLTISSFGDVTLTANQVNVTSTSGNNVVISSGLGNVIINTTDFVVTSTNKIDLVSTADHIYLKPATNEVQIDNADLRFTNRTLATIIADVDHLRLLATDDIRLQPGNTSWVVTGGSGILLGGLGTADPQNVITSGTVDLTIGTANKLKIFSGTDTVELSPSLGSSIITTGSGIVLGWTNVEPQSITSVQPLTISSTGELTLTGNPFTLNNTVTNFTLGATTVLATGFSVTSDDFSVTADNITLTSNLSYDVLIQSEYAAVQLTSGGAFSVNGTSIGFTTANNAFFYFDNSTISMEDTFGDTVFRLHNTRVSAPYGYAGVSMTNGLGSAHIYTDQGKLNFATGLDTNIRAVITSGGNFGLGTTNPLNKLDVTVNNTLAIAGLYQLNTSGNGLLIQVAGNTNENIASFTSNSGTDNVMFVKSSGFVGVGTDTPEEIFDVKKSRFDNKTSIRIFNTSATGSVSNAGMSLITGGASAGDPFLTMTINGVQSWTMGVDNSDSDKFILSSNAGLDEPVITVTTIGRVGFGTTSPTTDFDLRGNQHIHGNLVFQTIRRTIDFVAGADIDSYSAGNNSFLLEAEADSGDSTKADTSTGNIYLNARNNSAAGNYNAIVLGANSDAKFIMDFDGTVYMTSSVNESYWDSEHDISLIRATAWATGGAKNIIQSRWDKFVKYNADDLDDMGIITKTGLMNIQSMVKLISGGMWQDYIDLQETKEMFSNAIENVMSRLDKLEAMINER